MYNPIFAAPYMTTMNGKIDVGEKYDVVFVVDWYDKDWANIALWILGNPEVDVD